MAGVGQQSPATIHHSTCHPLAGTEDAGGIMPIFIIRIFMVGSILRCEGLSKGQVENM